MMGDTLLKKLKILLQAFLVKVERWRFSPENTTVYLDKFAVNNIHWRKRTAA